MKRSLSILFCALALQAGAQNYCNNPVPPCDPNSPASPCYKPPDPPPKCEPKECDKCTKSPCYVGSGAYGFDVRDLNITATGLPITVGRLYQSTHTIDGESGYGWASSLSSRLYYAVFLKAAPDVYQREADVRLPNGTLYRFVENADGTYTAPEGRFDTLVRNGDGSWDLQLQRTRTHIQFSATGNLTAIVDEYGNTQTWTYVNDRLSRIADSSGSGRFIDVTYGADGRISDVTDHTGRNVHYTYNGSGVMTAVTNPAGQTTAYSYVAGKYVPLLSAITDHWGRNITSIVYDAQDRVRSYTDKGETYTYTYNYNGVATTTAKSDSSGNAWQYPFTSGGLVSDSIPPGGGAVPHDDYYPNGLIKQRTDPAGVKTFITYDARGNPLTVTKDYQGSSAVQWRYTYDANFPDKLVSKLPYDPATGLIHQHWQGQKFDYWPPGSAAPGAPHHEYVLAKDGVTAQVYRTYTWDTHGRLLSATDAGGNVTNWTYDAAGNVATSDTPPNNDAGLRLTTTYTHDALGRPLSVALPDGRTISYTWDVLDRKTTINLPKPSPSSTLTFTTTYFFDEYDAATQLLFTRVVDPNGVAMRMGFDAYGQQVRLVDAAGGIMRNVYTKGLLTSQVDANNDTITYAYDARRRLTTMTYSDGTFDRLTYNADSTIANRRDRKNQTIAYTYDRHKRLLTTTYPNGGVITRTYTGQKLTQINDTFASPAETHTFTWDDDFRLTGFTQGPRGTLTGTYNTDRRLATIALTGGATRTYGYYPNGSIRTIAWSVIGGTFKYDYTPAGEPLTITFPNGQTRNYTRDDLGRITALSTTHPTTGTVAAFTYGYDFDAYTGQPTLLGQRTTISATVPALGLANAVTKLGYDSRYFLTRADYPAAAPFNGRADSWTWDAAGNRLSATVNGVTAAYSYSQWRLQSDGSNTYTYDANGNTIARSGSRGNFTFSIDYENRLRSVNGDLTAGYLYDAAGRRTLKTVSGAATSYVYEDAQAVAETGANAAEYLFGPGIDEPLAMIRGGQISYYAADAIGSIATLNDSSGAVQNSYAWDLWGNALARNETVGNPLLYTAREDAEAGMLFYRARFYEPATGRFTAEDPMQNAEGRLSKAMLHPTTDTDSLRYASIVNSYTYAGDNPAWYRDPLGLYQQPGCDRIPGCYETPDMLACCYWHDVCYDFCEKEHGVKCRGIEWFVPNGPWPCRACNHVFVNCMVNAGNGSPPPPPPPEWVAAARRLDPPDCRWYHPFKPDWPSFSGSK